MIDQSEVMMTEATTIKRKILFNGDAVAATGFARANHKIAETLIRTWDLEMLGINYWGEEGHGYPYRIRAANPGGKGDAWGLWRVGDILQETRPDILLVHNDPWNVAEYVKRFAGTLPVVAFMPVDAKNCKSGRDLNGLTLAIFYTRFALDEARKGGYEGPACVIGLGVDREIYQPMSTTDARARVIPAGLLPDGAFIVGNVNRNQPRKRLDLTMAYFAEWIKTRRINDAWLYLHLAPTGDKGWDIKQLARYYGISNRLILPKANRLGVGVTEKFLAHVYATFSMQVNTGVGEGFGLTTLEGMACGIPQVVGDWAGLGEWATAARRVPCTSTSTMWQDINTIGGVPDREAFIDAMDGLYRSKELRDEMAQDSLVQAQQPEFSWDAVGKAFDDVLNRVLDGVGPSFNLSPVGRRTELLS